MTIEKGGMQRNNKMGFQSSVSTHNKKDFYMKFNKLMLLLGLLVVTGGLMAGEGGPGTGEEPEVGARLSASLEGPVVEKKINDLMKTKLAIFVKTYKSAKSGELSALELLAKQVTGGVFSTLIVSLVNENTALSLATANKLLGDHADLKSILAGAGKDDAARNIDNLRYRVETAIKKAEVQRKVGKKILGAYR